MRAPSSMNLLLAWERGLDQSPTRRALELLAASAPEIALDKLGDLPIGARDTRLLDLRESLFGGVVAAVSQCPQCGDRLDIQFNIDDVRDSRGDAGDYEVENPGIHRLSTDGYDITYRVPTSADLLALSLALDDGTSQVALLQRCVIGIHQAGVSKPVSELPDTVSAALSNGMADADPQAQTELILECPACGHAWPALFDIAGFLWSEVHTWAHRILHEVHTLARAYGWREPDILAMSARRRQIYLELAQS